MAVLDVTSKTPSETSVDEEGKGVAQTSTVPRAKATRVYHNKVRTGCKTCKIRRIRCDEQKPFCRRCVSTGRTCDGYGMATANPPVADASIAPHLRLIAPRLPPRATADLVLLRTGRPADELRSYRFFQEVTAPSLAGAMNSDFWFEELPRVCQNDRALWHAVVSLGSAYESYLLSVSNEIPGKPANQKNAKTLTQLNAAIRGLTESLSVPGNLWKALTASAIFICVSVLDGQNDEAVLHFQHACRLLQELDAKGSDESSCDGFSFPVSLVSLRAILIGFQFVIAKLSPETTSNTPSLITSEYQDHHSAWKVFHVPPVPPDLMTGYLTPSNLAKAARATESLFMTLAVASLKRITYFRELYEQGGYALVQDAPAYKDPEICVKSFKNIERAVELFRAELEGPQAKRIRPAELSELYKAYLFLRIVQASNRNILHDDPDEPDPRKRLKSLPALSKNIVDLYEQIYNMSTSLGCHREGGPVPTSSVMNPLVYMVRTGFHHAAREKSIRLLTRPRLEGIWDSRMAAKIARKFLNRETAASKEYRKMPELDGITIDHNTARGWDESLNEPDDEEQGQFIHPLARICLYSMKVASARELNVTVWTWKDWLERAPGETTYMKW